MLMKGKKCRLEALENKWAPVFTDFLRQGVNFEHTFTGSIPMRDIDVAEEWEKERKSGSLLWGIFSEEYNFPKFLGTVGLYSHRNIYRSWEFRILIGAPGELGRGIGTEAAGMVVDWGFRRLNAHRIWLGVNAENERAIACYEKVGFQKEGRLRDEIWCQGHYVDALRLGLLEDEWRSIAH